MSKFVLYLSIVLVVPSATIPFTANDSQTREMSTEMSPISFVCEECAECTNPELVGLAVSTDPAPKEWLAAFSCPQGWFGECEEMNDCGLAASDAEDLQRAVETGDPHELVDVLQRPGVDMIADRSAIQVMDCRGDHVAYQVSLDGELLTEVAQLQDE